MKYNVCTRELDTGTGDTRQSKNHNLTYKTTTVALNKRRVRLLFGVEMAFLQYNLLGSSISGDVSEPTGNYHNKNSIHKLTAVPNFLLPFASKSH